MINKCIDCEKKISKEAERCNSCANKDERNAMFGVRSPNYEDGRTNQQYFCIGCDKKITYQGVLYGSGRCRGCSNSIVKKGTRAWNKNIKNSTGKRSKEINKNTIIKHHIYLKENDKETIEIKQGLHRSLHWKGYEYIIKLGLIKDYLEKFMVKYDINPLIDDGKIVHHIDCNRENNNSNNFLYLESMGIHNKLHQEAYEYIVKIGMIYKYLKWFFSKEREKSKTIF